MIFWILITIFLISFITFILYNSHNFQILIRNKLKNKLIYKQLLIQTQGKYLKFGYFSPKHKIISKSEYTKLLKRQKINLTPCHSILTFKTLDADWELFFTLIKESGQFKEYLIIKCYTNNIRIKSKVAVERIHSKLEIYSNNQSLMKILNKITTQNILSSILPINEETLTLTTKSLQYKGIITKNNLSKTNILHKITHINEIKDLIYTHGLKPY